MSWGRRAYPAMFAVFPIVGVAANNPGYYRLVDVVVLSLIALIGAALLYGIVYAILRMTTHRTSGVDDLAALVSLLMIGAFYFYGPFPLGDIKLWVTTHPAYAVLIAAAVAGALYAAKRRGLEHRLPSLSTTGRFFTLTGAILLCVTLGRLAYYEINDLVAIHRSALVRDLARPVPTRAPPNASYAHDATGARLPKRDIYILLLDEYAATDVYRERFGYDNASFEDSLRALGFRIPQALRSNYANTLLSITSLLNFAQMRPLAEVMNPRSRDFSPAVYLMEHNRAERFLKSEGYRFVFFPSAWYSPTRGNRDADEEHDTNTGHDLAREIHHSWIAQYFSESTLFSKVVPYLTSDNTLDVDHAMRTFSGIPSIARDPRPTFTFAHVLMPHLSYNVDSACKPLQEPTGIGALPGELQCVNRQTLEMARALIAASPVQPIIIIQGDHGSQSLKPFADDTALPSTAQARERFRPFGAYYLPGGGDAALPDSTSIVNILRYVFAYYFNADLKPIPNTMYYSHWRYPYRMTEVDANFHVVTALAAGGGDRTSIE